MPKFYEDDENMWEDENWEEPEPIFDSPGRRCNCEDAPYCGCNQ